ncbi:minor tail protein [Escherichia phage H8]|uniref:minor tail protein n=1 Tax=Escherichia phage H8 TaxID=2886919 RepID=UPI0001D25F47|nr:minor tail protein [Escherichia phage H8]
MEIIVIILAVMLFIVTFVSFAIMRRARELAEDLTKLRGELAALKLQREALKLFVVQGSLKHTTEDFITYLKRYMGIK